MCSDSGEIIIDDTYNELVDMFDVEMWRSFRCICTKGRIPRHRHPREEITLSDVRMWACWASRCRCRGMQP